MIDKMARERELSRQQGQEGNRSDPNLGSGQTFNREQSDTAATSHTRSENSSATGSTRADPSEQKQSSGKLGGQRMAKRQKPSHHSCAKEREAGVERRRDSSSDEDEPDSAAASHPRAGRQGKQDASKTGSTRTNNNQPPGQSTESKKPRKANSLQSAGAGNKSLGQPDEPGEEYVLKFRGKATSSGQAAIRRHENHLRLRQAALETIQEDAEETKNDQTIHQQAASCKETKTKQKKMKHRIGERIRNVVREAVDRIGSRLGISRRRDHLVDAETRYNAAGRRDGNGNLNYIRRRRLEHFRNQSQNNHSYEGGDAETRTNAAGRRDGQWNLNFVRQRRLEHFRNQSQNNQSYEGGHPQRSIQQSQQPQWTERLRQSMQYWDNIRSTDQQRMNIRQLREPFLNQVNERQEHARAAFWSNDGFENAVIAPIVEHRIRIRELTGSYREVIVNERNFLTREIHHREQNSSGIRVQTQPDTIPKHDENDRVAPLMNRARAYNSAPSSPRLSSARARNAVGSFTSAPPSPSAHHRIIRAEPLRNANDMYDNVYHLQLVRRCDSISSRTSLDSGYRSLFEGAGAGLEEEECSKKKK